MIKLNAREQKVYTNITTCVIPTIKKTGIYHVRDLCGEAPVCARIARRLYEEIAAGDVPGASLAGKRSAEGYLIKARC